MSRKRGAAMSSEKNWQFEGVFPHAGQIRKYNITKKEWVLKGDTVTYAAWNSIKDTLDYDFGRFICSVRAIPEQRLFL